MHRSRMFGLFIDTPEAEAPAAAAFWSAALGGDAAVVPPEPQFTVIRGAFPDLRIVVQSVDDAPRYHVDIETDDVHAEVERLLALGATRVRQWLECHVLRAPGGHLLCVIPVHSERELFDREATAWP